MSTESKQKKGSVQALSQAAIQSVNQTIDNLRPKYKRLAEFIHIGTSVTAEEVKDAIASVPGLDEPDAHWVAPFWVLKAEADDTCPWENFVPGHGCNKHKANRCRWTHKCIWCTEHGHGLFTHRSGSRDCEFHQELNEQLDDSGLTWAQVLDYMHAVRAGKAPRGLRPL